ncbi:myoneurin-like isoform X1 [Anopheles darlingi]|uniref:myoneurin-like isoform X1 n=1 Tax=Anopheles darlingi TaxID=43151 RepID=UPI0021003BAA|nr:myoneurin-like isoform X1 [Anopheles darlingi]
MLTKYCRICLTSAGVVHQLDEVVHKSLTLYAMLCKMYPEAFADYKGQQWPTRACDICKQAILDAYGLYVVCMSTLDILKKRLKKKQQESRTELNFSSQCFAVPDSDVVDFTAAARNKSNEGDDKSSLTSEEEIVCLMEEQIDGDGEGYCNASFLFSEQQGHVEDEKDIVLKPQIGDTIEIPNETAASYSHEIVELSVEMDCAAPNNTISIEQEHLDDPEESMEYLECIEDSLRVNTYQENDDNVGENAMVKSAIAMPEVTGAIMNSVCLKNDSQKDENDYGEIFSSQIFSCKSCQDVFFDKKTLEKHLKYHRIGFHIFCKMCHKGFKHETALYTHKCAFDSSTLCWICGKLLDTLEKHKRHMEAHMPEGSWACQLCPLRFSTQTAMNSHEYIHKKDIRHCCDICGVNLSSKRNLKYHQRAVHGGGIEKLHPCNVCGRRFAIPSMLKSHMNTHTGHRPYSCVYCNRVYGSGGDLVEHVAKHHVGNDNIYQCHLCDADFPKIKEIRIHYEAHYRNGEKLDNEILTEFGRFRFTIMDLLKMRRRKETTALSNDNANNQFPSSSTCKNQP